MDISNGSSFKLLERKTVECVYFGAGCEQE